MTHDAETVKQSTNIAYQFKDAISRPANVRMLLAQLEPHAVKLVEPRVFLRWPGRLPSYFRCANPKGLEADYSCLTQLQKFCFIFKFIGIHEGLRIDRLVVDSPECCQL